jgi:hypothetical protein
MTASPPGSALATVDSPAFTLQVRSVDDLARLARVFAASGLFGRNGNQETQIAECAIRLMAGMEAGFSPFASATGVHIIEGKPAFSSNLLAQAVRRHPVYDYQVLEHSATVCRIQFTAHGQHIGVSEFTIEMAKRAGLATKSIWQKYPENLLFARALTSGMRTHCPDALGGATAYTKEELGGSDAEPVAVTVTEVTPPQPQPQEPTPTLAELRTHATIACRTAGLTLPGLQVFCSELTGGNGDHLDFVSPDLLAKIGRNGISPETVARCNAAGEAMTVADDDEPPAIWQTTEPTASPA